jgi:hypothetical protein
VPHHLGEKKGGVCANPGQVTANHFIHPDSSLEIAQCCYTLVEIIEDVLPSTLVDSRPVEIFFPAFLFYYRYVNFCISRYEPRNKYSKMRTLLTFSQ